MQQANTKQNINLGHLRNQTELNAQEYKYGTFKAAQAYEQESRFAVDEASRELKRQAAAGDIQQNQTKLEGSENRLTLGEQGRQDRLNINTQGTQDRANIGCSRCSR